MRGTWATGFNSSQSCKIIETENTCKRVKHFKFSFCSLPYDFLWSLVQQDPTLLLCYLALLRWRQNVTAFACTLLQTGGLMFLPSVIWWAAPVVSSPMTLLLLSCSCHTAGSETVWQGLCQMAFFWGQAHRALGKEVVCHGQVSFPSGRSSNPHLYHCSRWIRRTHWEQKWSCNNQA